MAENIPKSTIDTMQIANEMVAVKASRIRDLEEENAMLRRQIERLERQEKSWKKLATGETIREFYGMPEPGDEAYQEPVH